MQTNNLAACSAIPEGEVIGQRIPDNDRERVLESVLSGQDMAGEHTILKKDGDLIFVESHGRTISRNGRRIRYSAVRDITDRKKAAKALQESEQRYRALFAYMNEGLPPRMASFQSQ
jgi:PAS domain-containing protein